ncbi:hypothetical protein P154DRAFT_225834 [Amniculicola lignicola CBS 123094]|uniref:Uncharacterized protein n=1 Tax=Amniculicola lignicola CBS 123094 TaxID=1392246 RepID=A0A6A5WPA0_9PLEO|nr:hypothetical protein P154DRAFT_225834 [Amniculicola lignicola CBS 123094]
MRIQPASQPRARCNIAGHIRNAQPREMSLAHGPWRRWRCARLGAPPHAPPTFSSRFAIHKSQVTCLARGPASNHSCPPTPAPRPSTPLRVRQASPSFIRGAPTRRERTRPCERHSWLLLAAPGCLLRPGLLPDDPWTQPPLLPYRWRAAHWPASGNAADHGTMPMHVSSMRPDHGGIPWKITTLGASVFQRAAPIRFVFRRAKLGDPRWPGAAHHARHDSDRQRLQPTIWCSKTTSRRPSVGRNQMPGGCTAALKSRYL